MQVRRREFIALSCAAALASLTACKAGRHGATSATDPVTTAPSSGTAASAAKAKAKANSLQPPPVTGLGSLAPTTPPGSTPSALPTQAGPHLQGQPIPTSQWWTSAMVGKLSLPMWAVPIALQVSTSGIGLSGMPATAMPDHIVTGFVTDLMAGSAVQSMQVTGYGAFHVELAVTLASGGTVAVMLVQGSPVVWLTFTGAAPTLLAGPGAVVSATGASATVVNGDRRWAVAASSDWTVLGNQLRAGAGTGAASSSVAIGLCPVGADLGAWAKTVSAGLANPITGTASVLHYDATRKVSSQTLTVTRASTGTGPFVLMPHHRRAAVGATATAAATSLGTYHLAVGDASVIVANQLSLEFTSPDAAAKLATLTLSAATKAAVLTSVRDDLADAPGTGGSYNGAKELGRLATIAEVARVIGADAERAQALAKLNPQLVDWLTYSGSPTDAHYFSYDPKWGGIICVPAEYGSQDYNDHHFHYGYFVRAAAIMAESDPQFVTDYGPLIDVIVADYAGSTKIQGLPSQRVFQPYLGHSDASGYVPFADGNNQESSSEAIQSWQAMARWGAVSGDADMLEQGRAHYAMETTCALLYWLGETPGVRPSGYAHSVAGIVWDAKVDFTTWFSPQPEAVYGIQLIPLNEGSAYRANKVAAQARSNEVRALAGGAPRMWGDLFAADLAVADPVAARAQLAAGVPREPSTGRAITRYWVELQAAAH